MHACCSIRDGGPRARRARDGSGRRRAPGRGSIRSSASRQTAPSVPRFELRACFRDSFKDMRAGTDQAAPNAGEGGASGAGSALRPPPCRAAARSWARRRADAAPPLQHAAPPAARAGTRAGPSATAPLPAGDECCPCACMRAADTGAAMRPCVHACMRACMHAGQSNGTRPRVWAVIRRQAGAGPAGRACQAHVRYPLAARLLGPGGA